VLDKLKATHYPMGGPSGDDFSEIAQVIVEQRIDTLIGMPGTVFQLFQREEARLRAYGGVKKVMLGGEHLGAGQRRWLRDCGVSTIRSAIYGTVDAGPLGHACAASPDGVFHLMSATQWLEIVDLEQDTPVARGERGRMLFTSLAREGHRVERYEVGDLGRWVDGACACGNRAPRFELLERHGAMLRVGTAFLRPNELARHAGAPIQMIVDYADAGHERLRVYVEADAAAVEACLRADADIQEAFECTLFELQVESRPQTEFQRNAIGKVPLVLDERLRAREAR
jgi:phenylacetate-coenzyme A ligase PaaK-like adenylate-forming protein